MATPALAALGVTMVTIGPILLIAAAAIAVLTAGIFAWSSSTDKNTESLNLQSNALSNTADATDEMTEAAGGLPQGFKDSNAELEKFIDLMDSILPLTNEELDLREKIAETEHELDAIRRKNPELEDDIIAQFDETFRKKLKKLEELKKEKRLDFDKERNYLVVIAAIEDARAEIRKNIDDKEKVRLEEKEKILNRIIAAGEEAIRQMQLLEATLDVGGTLITRPGGRFVPGLTPPPTPPMNDFISRPGQSPIRFSSDDTIIGTKNPGAFGGGGITIHIENLNASSPEEIVELLQEELSAMVNQ